MASPSKRTHIETLVEKDYLGAWDTEGRDFTLTIQRVEKKELTLRGGKKKVVPVLTFKEARKKFVLAARTNRDSISDIYGPYVEDWVGKTITIFTDPHCKSPNGGTCPGIRVRPMAPRVAAETHMPERPVDEDMRAQQEAAHREPGEEG